MDLESHRKREQLTDEKLSMSGGGELYMLYILKKCTILQLVNY
jgi:hypothetical protein